MYDSVMATNIQSADKRITLGSLFTGIGGFDLAAEQAGLAVRWQVENAPFCNRVLAKHWPDVHRYGDIREVDGRTLEPVDVITGGFPCQDLSIAGKREGITGSQSSLFFDMVRVIHEMRETTDGRYPTFVVFENVPGLLSSNRGRDFAVVLRALAELRPVEIAWRILDARFWGVPQRRRRVFIVVGFGAAGSCAGTVLFESESSSGDPAAGRETGTDIAGTLGGGAGKRGWCSDVERMTFVPVGVSDAVFLHNNKGRPAGRKSRHTNMVSIKEIVPALTTDGHMQSAVAYALCRPTAKSGDPSTDTYVFNWQSGGDVRLNISTVHTSALGTSQTPAIATLNSDEKAIVYQCHGTNVGLLGAFRRGNGGVTGGVPIVVNGNSTPEVGEDIALPLRQNDGSGNRQVFASTMGVRRLTCTEAERLMAFPDGHTCLCGIQPYSTAACQCPDGPRYGACGNAVVVRQVRWILQWVKQVIQER